MISLMNALLALCFLQDGGFVVTDGPTVSSFVVTERAQPKMAEKPIPPKPVSDAATVNKPRYYFKFYTADWCTYCKKFKNEGRLKQLQDLTEVQVIDTDKDGNDGVTSLPTIRLYDRETGKSLQEWRGYQDTSSMKSRYISALSSVAKPPARDNSFYGRKGTSHESRETLIQHLLNEGIHQGRHTRADLERLSDRELVDLHDEEHEDNGDVVKNGLWEKKK